MDLPGGLRETFLGLPGAARVEFTASGSRVDGILDTKRPRDLPCMKKVLKLCICDSIKWEGIVRKFVGRFDLNGGRTQLPSAGRSRWGFAHVIDFAARFSFNEVLFLWGSAHVAAGQWNPPTPQVRRAGSRREH